MEHSKKRLSSKGWLLSFAAMLLLMAVLWAGLNIVCDPFGAFGSENAFTWWSYEETLNPRVAKISYLDRYHDKYDSYILGSSSCSSWSVDELNEYLDAKFYNLINYGMDASEMEELAKYVTDNYTVKNLFVSLYIGSADKAGEYEQTLTYSNHYKVNGSSALSFYLKYLFADPSNAIQKIKTIGLDKKEGYLPAAYDCFNAETGAYDKFLRDSEPIGDLAEYVTRDEYKVFAEYPAFDVELPYISEMVNAVSNIKALCDEKGINLILVLTPVYEGDLKLYSKEDVEYFRTQMKEAAKGSSFFDYMTCDGCDDPRFFYDSTHFRNALGSKCLANMFKGEEISVGDEYEIPVLMYHSAEEGGGDYTISPAALEEHLKALRKQGYQTISFDELKAFADGKNTLPNKAVIITFDDGYKNNYENAYPLFKKYGMKATIFAIGKSAGKNIYTDGLPMTEHFSKEDAKLMEESGLIDIESHSFNMHQVKGRDPEPIRLGATRQSDETQFEYAQYVAADNKMWEAAFEKSASVFSYPEGHCDRLSEAVLLKEGIYATCSSEVKINTVVSGLPQSLRQLGRIDADGLSAEELIKLLDELK